MKSKKRFFEAAVVIFVLFFSLGAGNASTVLVSQLVDNSYPNYYGSSSWTNMTAALDNATGNSVNVAADLSNLSLMLAYDALWVDQRFSLLSTDELNNVSSFINTGRRVVLIGENDNWLSWNNQILGLVGGSYVGDTDGGLNNPINSVYSHPITANAPMVQTACAGIAEGGVPLYEVNFATLWGNQNVLTVLDTNILDDTNGWLNSDNAQFATNVANWVADSNPVPLPGAVWLFGSGLIGLAAIRRRKKQ